jgi:hypothetical protein
LVRFRLRVSSDDGIKRRDGRHRAELVEQNDHALRRDWSVFLVRFAFGVRPNGRVRRERGVRVRGGGEGAERAHVVVVVEDERKRRKRRKDRSRDENENESEETKPGE